MTEIPRFMVAAPNSGAGKTTVTLALLSALEKRGLSPVAYKCGPDYIDPMFHKKVLGIPSYNLDLFFAGEETVRGLLCLHAQGHGVAVIEGVMGYYDGIGATPEAGSYDLARATKTPVILVVQAGGAALSIAAVIRGFKEFRTPGGIAGVILNNCPEALYRHLKAALEAETGLPVLGYFPRIQDCAVKSRHLGLVTAAEISDLQQKIERLGAQAEKSIDLSAFLNIAAEARPLSGGLSPVRPVVSKRPRIAVAMDEAFCFYYADNLALLEKFGAEIVPFSPLRDRMLPEGTDALYLGGGYPELHAEALGGNAQMTEAIREAIEDGMPALAECGGFLYLHDALEDENGVSHAMARVLHGSGFRTPRLQRFGYIRLAAAEDNMLCAAGETIPAHEFHYWDTTTDGGACTARRPDGREWPCVSVYKNLFAGFPHLYFYGNPDFAKNFVLAASRYAK